MFHITEMLTQTKCDLTEALFPFVKVAMKVIIIYRRRGYVNVDKRDFVPNDFSTVWRSTGTHSERPGLMWPKLCNGCMVIQLKAQYDV